MALRPNGCRSGLGFKTLYLGEMTDEIEDRREKVRKEDDYKESWGKRPPIQELQDLSGMNEFFLWRLGIWDDALIRLVKYSSCNVFFYVYFSWIS